MGRLVSWAILIILLMNVFAAAFFVQPARAAGTIYIRADGSIDPPTVSLFSVDNVTYTFSNNITNDSIVVQRDNIIIDGASYTLQGTGDYGSRGINLSGRSNVTVKNTIIKNFHCGIWLNYSSNYNSISGNNMADNWYGIELDYSSNNSIAGNDVTANRQCGVSLLYFSNYNSVAGNNITANGEAGIRLSRSNYNIMSGNSITANNLCGFYVLISFNNSISGNIIADNGDGIVLFDSSTYNSISGNSITANTNDGIFLFYSSSFNHISGNNITNNFHSGISLASSSNNSIYHNNFVNNTQQVSSDGTSTNVWDDGYPSGGNYWSDYSGADFYNGPYQNETGSDGIGDTPYIIDENNTDHYPLMNPYVIPEFSSLLILPLFMIATLLAAIVHRKKRIDRSTKEQ